MCYMKKLVNQLPFTSTMRFGPERSKGPYLMASERFTNILSTWSTGEIKLVMFQPISLKKFKSFRLLNSNDRQFLLKLIPEFFVNVIRKICLGYFTCVLRTHFKEVLDVLYSYLLIKKE